jgi:glycosyltransferase involved in cell wall biosynthesis
VALPLKALTSVRALDRAVRGEQIDLVYTNTLAVVTGAVWASWRGMPHVWHVHELIERPRIARRSFGRLLRRSTHVVFNSHATQACYQEDFPQLEQNSEVIFNGVDRPTGSPRLGLAARADLRRQWGADEKTIVVSLVGRISRWKGQMLLIDAAERVGNEGPRLVFVFAGSPPRGQEHLLTALTQRIDRSPIRASLRCVGFCDPWPILDASDIAVVPSTRPEPFGLVAVEAMHAERPVIAAAHGGLAEIVEDGVTGRHVPPGDAAALAGAIAELAGDAGLRQRLGSAGRTHAEHFSEKRYVDALVRTLGRMLG